MHIRRTAALALCATLGLSGAAWAQATGAPAGRDPATAPGGTEGIAGPRNEMDAVRAGDAVAVPPSSGGIDAGAPAPVPADRVPPPAARP